MTTVSGQHELGFRIARALGLDPHKTRNIDLHIHCDDIIWATVEMYVHKEELELIELELKEFELHEKVKEETKE